MKTSRTLKAIIAMVLLVVTLFTFAGCDIILEYLGIKDVLTIEATYTGQPIEVGGTLNKEDIFVTATLLKGITTEEFSYPVANFQVGAIDTSTVGEKQVQISYTEMGNTATTTITVTVVKKPEPTSITATYIGGEIQVGGTLDASKFSVTINYDNGNTLTAQNFTVGQLDSSTPGDKMVVITYIYTEGTTIKTLTTSVKVTVVPLPITLTGIEANYVGDPIQTGETLSADSFLVQKVYSDGSKVTTTNFTFSTVDTSTAGTKQVTISCTSDGTTYTATVNVTVVAKPVTLVGISAIFNNDSFYTGDTLTNADFTVTANYSDDHSSIVTDFAITSATSFTTAGAKTVTLSYTYQGITKTCNVSVNVLEVVTLSSISAVCNKTDFSFGETLNKTNFVVTAHFSDGSSTAVSDFVIVSPTGSLTTTGTVEVEFSYTFNGVTRYTTVNINVLAEETVNYGKYGILSKDGKSVKIADTAKVVDTTDLQIHFLELGNQKTGDCVYIKAGNMDILIDAGSNYDSTQAICDYIDQYVTDGTLEYVIATHAHLDHLAGFVSYSSNGNRGIFKRYVCETIIDYARKNTTSNVSKNYEAERDAEVAAGGNHYTVLECWSNNNESTRFSQSVDATGARRYIKLASNIELEILYQKYYESKASSENDYSVCFMINQYGANYDYNNRNNPENEKNVNHFLFTGDLEEAGEKSLVQSNNLPKVVLYKAGHHGSKTSSCPELMSVIKPKVVCICCCTGSAEYTSANENQFPTQQTVNNIAPYTDLVFATSLYSSSISSGSAPLNGDITLTCNHLGINLTASNNITLLKDTAWFKANRICPTEWK